MTADRVTRKQVEAAFVEVFGELAASRVGATSGGGNAHNIGKYALDYNSVYGGFEVIIYSGGDSGAGWCHGSLPWGHMGRRPARAMLDWLNGVRVGKQLAQ